MPLTKTDLEKIGEVVDEKIGTIIPENNKVLLESIDGVVDEKINASEERLSGKMAKLADSVQKTEDTLVKEIQASQDERVVQTHQINRNTKRIEKIETRVFKN